MGRGTKVRLFTRSKLRKMGDFVPHPLLTQKKVEPFVSTSWSRYVASNLKSDT